MDQVKQAVKPNAGDNKECLKDLKRCDFSTPMCINIKSGDFLMFHLYLANKKILIYRKIIFWFSDARFHAPGVQYKNTTFLLAIIFTTFRLTLTWATWSFMYRRRRAERFVYL